MRISKSTLKIIFFSLLFVLLSRPLSANTWQSPTTLVSPTGSESILFGKVQSAMDALGNAIFVWSRQDPTSGKFTIYGIKYNAIFPSIGWGTAAAISSESSYALFPVVDMNDTGQGVAAWYQMDEAAGIYKIYASKYNGTSFEMAEVVSTNTGTFDATAPKVIVSTEGNLAVFWQEEVTATAYGIYLSERTTTDTAWAAPQRLDTATAPNSAQSPDADIVGSSVIAIVYSLQVSSTRSVVVGIVINSDGTTSTNMISSSSSNTTVSFPVVARLTDETAIAVWRQRRLIGVHEATSIYSSVYSLATRSWTTPERRDILDTTVDVPFIVSDDSTAYVVWSQTDTSGISRIYFTSYTSSGGSGAWLTTTVLDSGSMNAYFPSVAANGSGYASIVWQEGGAADATSRILAMTNSHLAGWSTATYLDSGSSHTYFPSTQTDSAGNMFTVWRQDNGSGIFDVLASNYAIVCGDGTMEGTELCDDGNTTSSDGCSSLCTPDLALPPTPETNCIDLADNDSDGLTDCDDADCAIDPVCASGVEICDNDRDDDGDSLIDCDDDPCKGNPGCIEIDCSDGADNEGDGAVDCNDPDCSADPACTTAVPESPDVDAGDDGDEDAAAGDDDGSPEALPDGGTSVLCGNSVLDTNEECDDGNMIDSDGCSGVCVVELTGSGDAGVSGPDIGVATDGPTVTAPDLGGEGDAEGEASDEGSGCNCSFTATQPSSLGMGSLLSLILMFVGSLRFRKK